MIHKHCVEGVDRSFRDILRVCSVSSMGKPFGGKIVVFGGDFRKILPVVPKGSRKMLSMPPLTISLVLTDSLSLLPTLENEFCFQLFK